ncbi:MAG: hypothetical protein CMJ89_12905 [Planctomycetes bacterium]|nr:hypothetical protein [Planctomycetota bacterium]
MRTQTTVSPRFGHTPLLPTERTAEGSSRRLDERRPQGPGFPLPTSITRFGRMQSIDASVSCALG